MSITGIKAFHDLKASKKSLLLETLMKTPNTPFKSNDLDFPALNVQSDLKLPALNVPSDESLNVNLCLDSSPSLALETCPTEPLDCCPTPAPVLCPTPILQSRLLNDPSSLNSSLDPERKPEFMSCLREIRN